jgi:hypothetical protein
MWHWIKRWRDWAMHNNLWPLHRIGPQPQALHYSYEKAGLTVHDQPIPWNAEAVVVEATVRISSGAPRKKADFVLTVPGLDPQPAESLRRPEGEDFHRALFRLPPLSAAAAAEVRWRDRVLGQITLPVLTREAFVQNLRLQMPTLFARLGDETVACQTFVSTQCRGLMVTGLLTSPTSLVPLLDLDLQVEFRSERGASPHTVPARLCSSQLAGRQALVTVVPKRLPRRIGNWLATWRLGEQPLATQRVRAISQRAFQKSLRISDTRFVVQAPRGGVKLARQLPPPDDAKRVGPCFLVCSREPGMAGLCHLQVRAQVPGAVQQPVLLEEEVLVSDGPTPIAPGTLDRADLAQVTGFELCLKGRSIGAMSLCPAPTAAFTAEGGFRETQEYCWSSGAEEELNERLGRLFEGRGRRE